MYELKKIKPWWNHLHLHTQIALLSGIIVSATIISQTYLNTTRQTLEIRERIDKDIHALVEHLSLSSQYSILRKDYASIEDQLLKLVKFPHILSLQVTDIEGGNLGLVVKTESNTQVKYPTEKTPIPEKVVSLLRSPQPQKQVLWYPINNVQHLGWIQATYTTAEILTIQRQTWIENLSISAALIILDIVILLLILHPPMFELRRATLFASNLDANKGQRLALKFSFIELRDLVSALNNTSIRLREQDDVINASNRRLKNIARELRESKVNLEKRIEERTQQLSWQANHDPLTSLFNRFEFERQLHRLKESCLEHPESGHVIFYLDLDQFKIVNDTCGHVAGDELLRQVSFLLSYHLRETDIITRLGGDEFGILLENCHLEMSTHVADNLLKELRNFRFSWNSKIFNIGASIGIVEVNNLSGSIDELLSSADIACYTAKDMGRNRYHIFHAEDEESTERSDQMHWVSKIHNALDNNQFCLYQQSIKSLHNKDIHYEVLIRMKDADQQIHSPYLFIPAAERYGLMHQIDKWVIKNFFSHYHQLSSQAKGSIYSINLSGASVGEEATRDFIKDAIRHYEIPAERLCFEITETAAISNLGNATALISELKRLGCLFSLDDFGTGLSSFSYLKTLKVDYIKIDGSFVRDMKKDKTARTIVEAINNLGHSVGLQTIAEYVESAELLQAVSALGVDYAQGYAIDKPNPIVLENGEIIPEQISI
ncbi:MAG: EAL domain-containing protein [Gammaproteobacteria bacterium]|nr:EAL domain-containing protein [Gammaproteobacteria bacterium]